MQTHEGLLPSFVNVGLHVVDPEGGEYGGVRWGDPEVAVCLFFARQGSAYLGMAQRERFVIVCLYMFISIISHFGFLMRESSDVA